MAKQVLIFWGIKVANFCQEVLNFLGSYTRVFTVTKRTLKGNIIVIFHEIQTPHSERGKTERSPDWQGKVAYKLIFRI